MLICMWEIHPKPRKLSKMSSQPKNSITKDFSPGISLILLSNFRAEAALKDFSKSEANWHSEKPVDNGRASSELYKIKYE